MENRTFLRDTMMEKSLLRSYRLFGIVILLLIFISIFILNSSDQRLIGTAHANAWASKNHRCTPSHALWNAWTSHIRFCLFSHIRKSNQSIWYTLHKYVDACIGEAARQMLDIRPLKNRDDVKFVILPRLGPNRDLASAKTEKCTAVTLGIGNDVTAELKLQKLMPNCQFYGADPSLDQGRVYEQRLGGKYFQMAIADRNGIGKVNILDKGGYHIRDFQTISIADFLINHVKNQHIDYLFLDNEGSEYGIMAQFLTGGSLEDTAICQISVELHGPLDQYGMTEITFNRLIENLIQQSPFIPLWSGTPINHLRSFYVNVVNPYCVEKYFSFMDVACGA